jgi:N-acetylglutamate synthase-like GNAT family acetyltransferase
MSKFTIRPATSEDSSTIRSLVIKGNINPTGLDWRRFILAVTHNGEIIGCGQIKPHRDGSQELASLAVTEERRGLGVAREILEHLIASQEASEEGPIYLMCRSSLGPLYEKFGFEPVDHPQMPKYFQRISRLSSIIEILRKEGETLLIMKRDT